MEKENMIVYHARGAPERGAATAQWHESGDSVLLGKLFMQVLLLEECHCSEGEIPGEAGKHFEK